MDDKKLLHRDDKKLLDRFEIALNNCNLSDRIIITTAMQGLFLRIEELEKENGDLKNNINIHKYFFKLKEKVKKWI